MTDITLQSQSSSLLPRLGRWLWPIGTVGALIGVLAVGFFIGQWLTQDDSEVVELPTRPVTNIARQPQAIPAIGVNESSAGVTVSLDQPGKANLGQAAPDFTIQTPDGQAIRLSDYQGRPVLINFWATWCAPCLLEMPALEQTYQKYKSQGLVVLAVNQAEAPDRVKQYMTTYKLSFPAVLDNDLAVSRMYRVTGYPTTWLVDREGHLRQMRRGAFTDISQIDRWLRDVLTFQ